MTLNPSTDAPMNVKPKRKMSFKLHAILEKARATRLMKMGKMSMTDYVARDMVAKKKP